MRGISPNDIVVVTVTVHPELVLVGGGVEI